MVCYYHLFNSFPVHCDPDSQMLSHSWVIKKARELKKKKSPFASLTTLKPLTLDHKIRVT